MAAAAKKSTGTTYWIGTTAADGASDTYTQIKRCKNVSVAGGGAFTMADTTAIEDSIRQTTKTLLDPTDIDLEINEIPGDAGQTALKAAYDDTASDDGYNFEARYPNGDKRRLKAKVTSHQYNLGTATSIRMIRAKLEPTTDATFIAAS
jgi:hypothetical protein